MHVLSIFCGSQNEETLVVRYEALDIAFKTLQSLAEFNIKVCLSQQGHCVTGFMKGLVVLRILATVFLILIFSLLSTLFMLL